MDIRQEIADNRVIRIEKEGYGLSVDIPESREVPLNSFEMETSVICEVKRGSPSKGKFADGLDAIAQAGVYFSNGVRQVSVLTEEDRFFGSLQDLMDIKIAYPDLAVLRKDFLVDIRDVEVSYLCGADAILLIASLLEKDLLEAMYQRAKDLGMTPLVELHDREDCDKVRGLKPTFCGINSRNLKDFSIDPLRPLKIRSFIDWDCRVIYESGIKSVENGVFARDCGFNGVLVGEFAVRNPELSRGLVRVFNEERGYSSWERLFKRYSDSRPFIKVCGITNSLDYEKARELGADLTGFILAESPRRVEPSFIRTLGKDCDVLRVGVVVLKSGETLNRDIIDLVKEGFLDFIQFHGDESRELCESYNIDYYKAHRVKDFSSLNSLGSFSYADLIDSFDPGNYGGTGKVINKELTLEASKGSNLWLAGGLNPDNIKGIISEFTPDLVDVSSGVESKPGIKDHNKMERFIGSIYGKI